MDFLERLDSLMLARNINKSVLSKESNIPYTTIDGFYKKGYANVKLSTIRKLSSYFGVTMDYLVGDDMPSDALLVSGIERDIIIAYRQADSIGKAIVLRTLNVETASTKESGIKIV